MRCLTPLFLILIIALVALTGYNYWRTDQLSDELAQLKNAAGFDASNSITGDDEVAIALEQASLYSKRAKTLLEKGKTEAAKAELNKCISELNKASQLMKDKTGVNAREIGEALSTLKKQADGVWKSLSEDTGRTKNARPKAADR